VPAAALSASDWNAGGRGRFPARDRPAWSGPGVFRVAPVTRIDGYSVWLAARREAARRG
jgi:hypothetical protein